MRVDDMKRLIISLSFLLMVGIVDANDCDKWKQISPETELSALGHIACLGRMVLDNPNISESDKERVQKIMRGVNYRVDELLRGAASGYRGNKSPGMGYGLGPDMPEQILELCGEKLGKCVQI